MKPQIYIDSGKGFNEEESVILETFPVSVTVGSGIRAFRIDPCSEFCVVSVEYIRLNGEEIRPGRHGYSCNGKKIGTDTYAFATSDPGFTVKLPRSTTGEGNVLEAHMTVSVIDAATAGRIG
jgi:hypothetical protein